MELNHKDLVLFTNLVKTKFHKEIGDVIIPIVKTLSVTDLVQVQYMNCTISAREYELDKVICLRCLCGETLITLTCNYDIVQDMPSLEIINVKQQKLQISEYEKEYEEFEKWCEENDIR